MQNPTSWTVPPYVRPELVFDFDIYGDSRVGDDPHVDYVQALRAAPPVFYTPRNGGHWIVTGYDEMQDVVRDPTHFSSSEMQIPRIDNPPKVIPLGLDPPENVPFRQMLTPAFSPKAIAALEPQLHSFARELVDAVAAKGECDFVADIAARYPVGVFMRLMGIPWERFEEFRKIAEDFFSANTSEQYAAAMGEIGRVMHQLVEEHRAAPRDDLTSHIINARIGDRPISENELMGVCSLLFMAGLDTVTNAMSFGCRYIARHPEIQARLRDDPGLLDALAEEVLRLFSVVNTPRLVVKDCERFGASFRAGDMLVCMLPMAGRQEDKNDKAMVFDLDRSKRQYLGFSTGPHLCLGHFLARSELKALFGAWFARIPEFRLQEQVNYGVRFAFVMSMRSLPLRWDSQQVR